MRRRSSYLPAILAASAMLVLILDSKTALQGASDGLDLCIRTLIPSLLPFFVLSSVLTKYLSGKQFRILAPLGKLCTIPPGQEGLFLVGILSGYPIGAQNIAAAYHNRCISKRDAERMLGFCNNAGPSFIFGVTACLFQSRWVPWMLWLIHIQAAIIVGILLPYRSKSTNSTQCCQPGKSPVIQQSIKSLAVVCCWVILIRVLVRFLAHWFMWMLPGEIASAIVGILELTNGCISLFNIDSESARFVLCSAMLGMGGICVLAQTISVTQGLDPKQYIHGKLLQTSFSIILATIMQPFLFLRESFPSLTVIAIATTAIILNLLLFTRIIKKEVAFPRKIMYNKAN